MLSAQHDHWPRLECRCSHKMRHAKRWGVDPCMRHVQWVVLLCILLRQLLQFLLVELLRNELSKLICEHGEHLGVCCCSETSGGGAGMLAGDLTVGDGELLGEGGVGIIECLTRVICGSADPRSNVEITRVLLCEGCSMCISTHTYSQCRGNCG